MRSVSFSRYGSILLAAALAVIPACAQKINLATQVQGELPTGNAGFGVSTAGLTGCASESNGVWTINTANCGVQQVTGPSSTVNGDLTFSGPGVTQSGNTFSFGAEISTNLIPNSGWALNGMYWSIAGDSLSPSEGYAGTTALLLTSGNTGVTTSNLFYVQPSTTYTLSCYINSPAITGSPLVEIVVGSTDYALTIPTTATASRLFTTFTTASTASTASMEISANGATWSSGTFFVSACQLVGGSQLTDYATTYVPNDSQTFMAPEFEIPNAPTGTVVMADGSSYGYVISGITGPSSTATGAATFTGSGVAQSGNTFTFTNSGGTLTNFSVGTWPSWLTPTVTNPTTTPALGVAASAIPLSALTASSITFNGATVSLGGSANANWVTTPTQAFPDFASFALESGSETTSIGELEDSGYSFNSFDANGAAALRAYPGNCAAGAFVTNTSASTVGGVTCATAVTSIGMTVPSAFGITGSPVTGTGTFTLGWTGSTNLFLGLGAGSAGATGLYNTMVGYDAGELITTAGSNTFVGEAAGNQDTTGGSDAFLGYYAGEANTGGTQNVFLGASAGATNTTESGNSYVGYEAGEQATAQDAVAVGAQAGEVSSGLNNVYLGYQAGEAATSGDANTFLGSGAGVSATTASSATLLGEGASLQSPTDTNEIAIGQGAAGVGSNTAIIGNSSTTKLCIASSANCLNVGSTFSTSSPFASATLSSTGISENYTSGASYVAYLNNLMYLDSVSNNTSQGGFMFRGINQGASSYSPLLSISGGTGDAVFLGSVTTPIVLSGADTTIAVSAGTQGANSCSTPASLTMTGLTTSGAGSHLTSGYTADPAALTGWGSTGGMVFHIWPSAANTAEWEVCNQTAASISYAAITFSIGVQ